MESTIKPSLLILAAGMGSRYGGIKQIEPIGPHGEIILEYSIYDALRAGFGKVIFVIRRDIEKDFDEHILPLFSSKISSEYVFQEITDLLPNNFPHLERKKPWGTAHAVLAAREKIHEPFAVINADDFYGKDAFSVMARFLLHTKADSKHYAMVRYKLIKTVSNNGTVSRGVCQVTGEQKLMGIHEHKKIEKCGDEIISHLPNGTEEMFSSDTPVSMNFFGFTPKILTDMKNGFTSFLDTATDSNEYLIPSVVDSVINKDSDMKVLKSDAQWFGITYKDDRPGVVRGIQELVDRGEYPSKLWE